MRFKEITYHKGKVLIKTEVQTKADEFVTTELESEDEPRETFVAAMNALAFYLIKICDLPPCYIEGLVMKSVKFDYQKDTMTKGAVLFALKALPTTPAPMMLRTPFLPEWPWHETSPYAMPMGMPEALTKLEDEAEAYMGGARFCEQPSLFPAEEFKTQRQRRKAEAPNLEDLAINDDLLDDIESRGY